MTSIKGTKPLFIVIKAIIIIIGPRTAMPRRCERDLRNGEFQQPAADADSSSRGRCRGRQRLRDDRRPCFSHRVSSCSRACQHCRMQLALPGRADLKLGEHVAKQLSNRNGLPRSGCKSVLQSNTPGDSHTIPLHVLCSVHGAYSTNTSCNTNRRH